MDQPMRTDVPRIPECPNDTGDFDRYRVSLKIDVSYSDHSHIIGRGGMNVAKIMREVECHIHFPDLNKKSNVIKSNRVCIFGHPRDVEIARAEIRKLMPVIYHIEVNIDKSELTSLFKDVKGLFGVQIYNRLGHIQIKGSLENYDKVQSATKHVLDWLDSASYTMFKVFMKLDITEQHHAIIRGPNNKQINKIMSLTNTKIVPPNYEKASSPIDRLVFLIFGKLEDMLLAREMIIGSLPIVLMFDVPNYVTTSSETLRNLMLLKKISICWKVKNETNVKCILIKSSERNVQSAYQAGYDLLETRPANPIPDLIPANYNVGEDSADEDIWPWGCERAAIDRRVSETSRDFNDTSLDAEEIEARRCFTAPVNKKRPFWRSPVQPQVLFDKTYHRPNQLLPPPSYFAPYGMPCDRMNHIRPFHSYGGEQMYGAFMMKSPLNDYTNRGYYDYASNGYINESFDGPLTHLKDRIPINSTPRYPLPMIYPYQYPIPAFNVSGPHSPVPQLPGSPLFFNNVYVSSPLHGNFNPNPKLECNSSFLFDYDCIGNSAEPSSFSRRSSVDSKRLSNESSDVFHNCLPGDTDNDDSHLYESRRERESIKVSAAVATEKPLTPNIPRVATVKWVGYGLSKSTPTSDLPKKDSSQRLSSSAPVETSMFGNKPPLKLPCHISTFLAYLNLEKFTSQFLEHRIDFDSLMELSEEDLKKIGVNTFGARKKIIWAVRDIKTTVKKKGEF